MPFNPFSAITSKIFAATSGVLLIALGVLFLVHKHDLSTADKLRTEVATANAKLAVSNTSIRALQAAIDAQNKVAQQKAAEYASAERSAAAGNARLSEQAKSSDEKIARLKTLAAQPGDCKVKAETNALAEGL